MLWKFVSCLVLAASTSCATSPTKNFSETKVIERIGGKTETPSWADGSKAMFEEGKDVVFLSQMTMGADSRPEACIKAAELDGRSAMARYIKENITASGQINELNAASDAGYESLTAFLSQGKLSGVRPSDRYWEKIEQSDESGDRVFKLRCTAKIAIKKAELQRQLTEATSVQGGSPKIRDELLNAQASFINNLSESKDSK